MKKHSCKCGETDPKKFNGRTKSICTECNRNRARERYRNLNESDKKAYISNAKKNYNQWSNDNILKFRLMAAKHRAKAKGLDFNIDLKYLEELLNSQSNKCPYLNIELTYTHETLTNNGGFETISIDRIDSSKGYIKGNIELISGIVNSMKNSLSKKDFIRVIKMIYKNIN